MLLRAIGAASVLQFAASAASAQNAIVDGDFDTGTGTWSAPTATLDWSPEDSEQCQDSGSARVTGTAGTTPLQTMCVGPVTNANTVASMRVRLVSGSASARVAWTRWISACVTPNGVFQGPSVPLTSAWTTLTVAPASGIQTATFRLEINAAGPYQLLADRAFLGVGANTKPSCVDPLFQNGFE